MYKFLSLMIIFTFVVSCSQPDNKDKNTGEKADSKEISQKAPQRDETVVAKVNDKPIYKYELDNNLVNPLKEAIVYEVLLEDAISKGYRKGDFSNADMNDPKVKLNLAIENDNAVKTLKAQILSNVNVNKKVTDKDVNTYYNNNIKKYTYVAVLKYTISGDEDTANEIREMLVGGSTVNDIRDQYGDKGVKIEVSERKLNNDPIILDNLDVVEVGAISKPIRFAGNYDIYKVTEMKKADIEKFKTSIKQNIKSLRKQSEIYKYVDNLIDSGNYNVTVLEGDQ